MQQAFQHGVRSSLLDSILSRRVLAPALDNLHAIRDVTLSTKNASLQVIVLHVGPMKKTREGRMFRTLRVADPSGSIMFTLWNDPCVCVKPSEILQLTGIGTTMWQGQIQLKMGPKGSVTKVGEFCMLFSTLPDFSIPSPEVLKAYAEQQERNVTSQMGSDGELVNRDDIPKGESLDLLNSLEPHGSTLEKLCSSDHNL